MTRSRSLSTARRDASSKDSAARRQPATPGLESPEADLASAIAFLQGTLGNHAVGRLIQQSTARPAIGPDGGPLADDLASRIQASRAGGQTIDPSTRRSMEAAFGENLGDVRVHADRESDALNRSVDAVAFTAGSDVFFRQGAYQPGSSAGNRLLAHELTHVVQQRSAGPGSPSTVGPADDAFEREAEVVAETVADAPASAELEATAPEPPAGRSSVVGTVRRLPVALASATASPSLQVPDERDLVDHASKAVLEALQSDPDDRSGRIGALFSQLGPEDRGVVLDTVRPRATPEQMAHLDRAVARTDDQKATGTTAPAGTEQSTGGAVRSLAGGIVGGAAGGLSGGLAGLGLVVSGPGGASAGPALASRGIIGGPRPPGVSLTGVDAGSGGEPVASAPASTPAAPDGRPASGLETASGGETTDLGELKAPTQAGPASASSPSAPAATLSFPLAPGAASGATPAPPTGATPGASPGGPTGAAVATTASVAATVSGASPPAVETGAATGGGKGAPLPRLPAPRPAAPGAAREKAAAHGGHEQPGRGARGAAGPALAEEQAVAPRPAGGAAGGGLAAMPTGDLALIDEELAEHQRWSAASSQVGAAGSEQRAAFVAEAAGSGLLTGFAQGAAIGLGMGIAAQAAEFVPIPGVGSILVGAMSAYGLATRNWGATADTISRFGEGSDSYEALANSIASIAEIIDVATNIMNVIAGIIGIISAVMWVVTVVTVGVAAPLAGTLSAIALAITEVDGVLGLINSLILQPCVMLFRALHTFTSQADPRDVEAQGAEISHAAGAAGGALGGLAGGALMSGGEPPRQEEPLPHPEAGSPPPETIAPAPGDGPAVEFNEPPSGTGAPGGIGDADTQMLPTGPGATEADTQMLPTGPGAAEAETRMLPAGPGAAEADTQTLPTGPGATGDTQMLPAGPGATEAATTPGMPAATEPQAGPAPPRNPVIEMTAVNPAEVYPGAPQPPGFQAGPVGTVEPPAPAPRDNNVQIWQNVAAPGEGNVQIWQNILEPPTGAPSTPAPSGPTEVLPPSAAGNADTAMLPGGPGATADTQMVPTGPGATADTQMVPTGPGTTADTQMAPAGPGAGEAPTERAPWNPDLENPQIPPPPRVPNIESPGDFGIEEPRVPPQPSPWAPTVAAPAPDAAAIGAPVSSTADTEMVPTGPGATEAATVPAGPAPADNLTGMRVHSLPSRDGAAEADWANVTDQDIEDWAAGIDASARSETFFEMDAAGLQDITTSVNDNPGQIAYNVNHYMSDVGRVRIARASDVPIGTPRAPGGSVIPEGVGTEAQPVPETSMANPDDTPVLNADGEPIGNQNVEVRYHSANPNAPAGSLSREEPSVQINTPSDRFGWAGNRDIAVEGETGRYMTPDGRWVTMGRGTSEADRAAAHFPVGRSTTLANEGGTRPGGGGPPPDTGTPPISPATPSGGGGVIIPVGGEAGGSRFTEEEPATREPHLHGPHGGHEGGDARRRVERVNPNYPPPPGTPAQLAQIRAQIENLLAARARAEQAEQHMAAQEQYHQANQGPIGQAVQETAGGITAVQSHQQAVAQHEQANQEQQQRQDQSQSLVSGYPGRAAGLAAIRVPLAAFQGFTHIASELPGDAGAAMLRMSHDADQLSDAFHQMDLRMEQQAQAQPARQQELQGDQQRIQQTGQQAQESQESFQKANAGAQNLQQANEAKIRTAQQAKDEAAQQKQTLGDAAAAKQQEAQTLEQQLREWANEHKQARLKALEETKASLEGQGYVVAEVKES